MKVNLPPKAKIIATTFENNNFELYLVGGAVRDLLMGKIVYDWDFTTNAKPEEIQKMFTDSFYDNKFGTVGIPNEIDGERPYEITTYRTEHGYSDSRRPDVVKWGTSLSEDLQRRDFTINAMALKIVNSEPLTVNRNKSKYQTRNTYSQVSANAELIDMFEGKNDLDNKLIRAVGEPSERFSEDALRMMRAVRIASELGFTIESKTFQAIKSNVKLISKVSKERIREELLKILKSDHSYEGMSVFRDLGLMDEVLPELSKTFGVEQKSPGRHHIYDVGTHSLLSLKAVSARNANPIVRLATLIHDIGKPQTFRQLDDGTITFYNHEMVSAKIANRISERLKFSRSESDKLYTLVRYHQFTVDERQTDSAVRRFIRKVGKENISDMLDLRIGDRLGGGARETSWRLEEYKKRLVDVQKQPFTVLDLKVSGRDVMEILGIKPGPKVGEILNNLFEKVVDKKLKNTKESLIRAIKEIKNKYD